MNTSDSNDRASPGEPSTPRDDRRDAGTVFDSQTLFDGAKEIGIRHEGQLYRLRITRHGRLILNK